MSPFRVTTRRARKGAAMVEGALVLTVYFMLIFGIVEFGWAVYAYNSVSAASRVGSRYAMVRSSASGHPASSTDILNHVSGQTVGLDRTALTVTTTWTPNSNPGSTVKVTVRYTYRPFSLLTFSNSVGIQASSSRIVCQ